MTRVMDMTPASPVTPASAGGIRIEGLRKVYGQGDTAVEALRNVNMTVGPGEVVGLVGPSGSGKSTLLKCLGAIIEPTSGRMVLGQDVIYDNGWKISDLRALRRDKIGFVFQAPYLIPFLDVTDNVALLPMLAGVPNAEARKKALALLTALDVQHRAKAMPSQLSGGEQQRVAIARALANSPKLILADEPTGNLDEQTGEHIIELLSSLSRDHNTTILVVTHDRSLANKTDRRFRLQQGRLTEEAASSRVAAGSPA